LKVKICGITRPADAWFAEGEGADFVGTILVPESPRCVSREVAREVGKAVSIPLVMVTADLKPGEAAELAGFVGASVIQLHGGERLPEIHELRKLGSWELWKAVRVRSGKDVREALDTYAGVVDLLLLDGWHPRALGGTGTRFDWAEVAGLRGSVPANLLLGVAGGLNPENVGDAMRMLRPDLVDVGSGVESGPGLKDHDRVRAFLRAART